MTDFNGTVFKQACFNEDGAFEVTIDDVLFQWSDIDNSILKGGTIISGITGYDSIIRG